MEKKWWGLMLIIVSIIIAVLLVLMIFFPKETGPYYSDDPRTWVDDKGGGVKEINVDKVTKGKGYFDDTSEQYKDINSFIETAFSYNGIYKGNGFFEEKYYTKIGGVDVLVMEITPEFNPTDGILQGIIIERIEHGDPESFLFLDEDWRKQFLDLYIVWGATYQNEKRFEFNSVGNGVYMDHVFDDKDRFTTESYKGVVHGGVIVGDLSRADIRNGNLNGTIILLV